MTARNVIDGNWIVCFRNQTFDFKCFKDALGFIDPLLTRENLVKEIHLAERRIEAIALNHRSDVETLAEESLSD
jgi:hypothetical protein